LYLGHTGTDGSTFSTRITRYGTWTTTAGENIQYGYSNAKLMVMALIVDGTLLYNKKNVKQFSQVTNLLTIIFLSLIN